MPIALPSNLTPRNAANPDPALRGTYFLLEDIYFKGGYQVRANINERDEINPLNRKQGMWVKTLSDGKLWELAADLTSWEPVSFGGGGGSAPRRVSQTFATGLLQVGEFDVLNLNIGPCCLLLNLSVNFPCTVEAYSTADKDETNPYVFKATEDKLLDDGLSELDDGTIVKNRRYSILANLETPTQDLLYFQIINTDTQPRTIELSLTFIPLETL